MCSICKNKKWSCLSCRESIPYEEFYEEKINKKVAVYCDCCDHNFVCKSCYDKNPGYNYWKLIFGNNHSIYDITANESDLSRTLMAIIGGYGLK
jgi:hypothetical protein